MWGMDEGVRENLIENAAKVWFLNRKWVFIVCILISSGCLHLHRGGGDYL